MLAAKSCQTLDVFKQLLLVFSTTPGGEGVSCIAPKPAGEVASRGWFVTTFQRKLISVVKLWHAARRQHKRIREFQPCDRRARLTHEATIIVTTEQGDENLGIRVEIVFRECLRNLIDWLPFGERVPNRVEQRKVEQRIESGINSVKTNFAALKERCMDHVAVLHFADDSKIRKLAFQRRGPVAPEGIRHVLPCVHANAVESGRAYPPECVLN